MKKTSFGNHSLKQRTLRAAASTLALALFLSACDNTENSSALKNADENSGTVESTSTAENTSIAEGTQHFTTMKPYSQRPVTDDIIYFMLPDRFANGDPTNDTGGWPGGRLDHGFDPTDKGFYHGGDLKGVMDKLDYLENMGVTAIWMAPIFKNKPVQGDDKYTSAGYHGYWITDFTQVDPHFGTNAELKALVEEAHSRNIKVIFDIITNHTADVIRYEECHGTATGEQVVENPNCNYRSIPDYPHNTVGNTDGASINEGFAGHAPEHQTLENFSTLTNLNYAFTPYVLEAEKTVKVPAWLNDLKYYHNRGDSTFRGESSLYGDFAGLDDLYTERPEVVNGFIDIYKYWISEFKIDGFRVDTVKHVNDSFWQQLSPALIEHAKAEGIEHFYIFGEVYDPSPKNLSHYTNVAKLPAVLDFGFQSAAAQVLAGNKGTDVLKEMFQQDTLYTGDGSSALNLPTFLGNHDMGRLAMMIRRGMPDISDDEVLKRVKLGHALMFFARGVPVIYSGDEQGFTGDGHDQDARADMFPSQTAVYNDNILLGTDKTTADANFDQNHPIYREIANLSALYRAHPALRNGQQTEVSSSDTSGLYIFTRTLAEDAYLLVFNSSADTQQLDITKLPAGNWRQVSNVPTAESGSLSVSVDGLSYTVYKRD